MKRYQFLIIGRGRFFFTLPELIEHTSIVLREKYGVVDLTIIERAILRRCVERVAENVEKQWKTLRFHKRGFRQIPQPWDEAAMMWFHEAYGLDGQSVKELAKSGKALFWFMIHRMRSHTPRHEGALTFWKETPPVKL